jgi:hypothetical protein
VVVPQQAAEALTTLDRTQGTPHFLAGHKDPIAQSSVIPFAVVMGEELTHFLPQ